MVEEHTGTYILNRSEFFRYSVIVIDDDVTKEKVKFIHVVYSNYEGKVEDGEPRIFDFGIFDNSYTLFNSTHDDKPLYRDKVILFAQIMVFVELTDIELVKVPHKDRIKRPSTFEKKFDNRTGTEVVFVDTSWNKIIVTEGFPVTGHFRVQPYGPGRNMHKLIWIDPFMKKGYRHRGGKSKIENVETPSEAN